MSEFQRDVEADLAMCEAAKRRGAFITIDVTESYIREVQRLRSVETELRAALELAQKWLANSVPVEDMQGPKPLPVIAATLAKNSEART